MFFEQWRDIVGYEGAYQISDRGWVKSLPRKGRLGVSYLKPNPGTRGYLRVYLTGARMGKECYVHRLVALHFLPPSDHKYVRHLDGNKLNNRADNLEWVSGKPRYLVDGGRLVRPYKLFQRGTSRDWYIDFGTQNGKRTRISARTPSRKEAHAFAKRCQTEMS